MTLAISLSFLAVTIILLLIFKILLSLLRIAEICSTRINLLCENSQKLDSRLKYWMKINEKELEEVEKNIHFENQEQRKKRIERLEEAFSPRKIQD